MSLPRGAPGPGAGDFWGGGRWRTGGRARARAACDAFKLFTPPAAEIWAWEAAAN